MATQRITATTLVDIVNQIIKEGVACNVSFMDMQKQVNEIKRNLKVVHGRNRTKDVLVHND